ncbi:hypothetical protein [Arthrobacter ginkgonis]
MFLLAGFIVLLSASLAITITDIEQGVSLGADVRAGVVLFLRYRRFHLSLLHPCFDHGRSCGHRRATGW